LSCQKYFKRAEHWVVAEGEGIVILSGKSIDIPRQAAHRIGNVGENPLVFIEIQYGDYFGEDDIVRLEDDYGRGNK